MGLEFLGSNFREITVAIQDDQSTEVKLVPNLFGTRIYHSSEGWGRLWKWFFNFIGKLIGDDFQKSKFHEAMAKTHQIYQQEYLVIQEQTKNYQTRLKERIEGRKTDDAAYHHACHCITDWNRETHFFSSLAKLNKNEKLKELFKMHYDEEAAFSCDLNEDDLQKMQTLINLEGVFRASLPWQLLKKLAIKQELNKTETEQIEAWIAKVNKKEELNVASLHKGLAACVGYFSTKETKANLLTLEVALCERGCTIFTREDSQHCEKREALQKEKEEDKKIVRCNGELIKLGDELGVNFKKSDKHVVFAIEDNPNEVIVIGNNPSILALEKHIFESKGGGTYFANYIDVDAEGACARVERLTKPLDKVVWTSKFCSINLDDETSARPIANLIAYWIDNQIMVQDMSLKHFMFSNDGVLKYSKGAFPHEIEWSAVENFIQECSRGNLAVFIYLMENSTLAKQPYRKVYTQMVRSAIRGEKKELQDVNEIAAMHQISDPVISVNALQLYKDVLVLKEKCCVTIFENYIVDNRDELSDEVNEALWRFYRDTKSGAKIWPSALEDIENAVISSMKLQARSAQ